jgi:polyhydroxyalkanoate synthase
VFIISWVNPDERHKDKEFKHYMYEGPIAAIAEIQKITGQQDVNVMAYCLGGTLLGTTLAYLEAQGKNPVKAATFLTTMLDFSDAGELAVFIDEEQISELEAKMNKHGYLDGKEMAITFNLLRPHDLIWSFVINNYLLGKKPLHFDLLYWNSDTTRMPAKMHSYYLRNMYLHNNLIKGNLEIDGVKIDVSKIKTACNFLSTKKDHIAPWKTTYLGAKMIENAQFMLTDSGHVAGVVNPPHGAKYNHWVNAKLPATPEEWEAQAHPVEGSWWISWDNWNKALSGKKIPARLPKNAIEDAPGSYAKVKS